MFFISSTESALISLELLLLFNCCTFEPFCHLSRFMMCSAGGGAEAAHGQWVGGPGGFVHARIFVKPGSTITVVCGDGGRAGNTVKASGTGAESDIIPYGFGGLGNCPSNGPCSTNCCGYSSCSNSRCTICSCLNAFCFLWFKLHFPF